MDHERRASAGRHTEGRVRPDVGRQASEVGRERAALRRLGDLPHEGIAGRSRIASTRRSRAAGSARSFSDRTTAARRGRPVGQQVRLRRRARHAPVVRRHAAPVGIQARLAPRAVARPIPTRSTPASRTPRCSARPTAGRTGTSCPACAAHGSGPHWQPGAGGLCLHTILIDPTQSRSHLHRDFRRRRVSHRRRRRRRGSRSIAGCVSQYIPDPTAEVGHCVHRIAHASRRGPTCSSCRSTGTSCAATMPATRGTRSAATCRPTSASSSTSTRTSRRRSTSCRSRATRSTIRRTASCASIAAAPAATSGRRSRTACRSSDCYVNVLRDAMAVDTLDDCGVYFGTTGGQVYASAERRRHLGADRPRSAGRACRWRCRPART